MNILSDFFTWLFNSLSRIPFDTLLLWDLCSYGGIFALVFALCFISRNVKRADKRPFFHLTNAFTAVTLALFATRYTAPQSIAAAALFWCVGYLLYALLCVISFGRKREREYVGRPIPAFLPAEKPAAPISAPESNPRGIPAAQSVVRLDHALAISDKLLLKTLGRGDRQELEKIKTALTILKVKGELTPQDGDALNDMFNALLKLMAKYDV